MSDLLVTVCMEISTPLIDVIVDFYWFTGLVM